MIPPALPDDVLPSTVPTTPDRQSAILIAMRHDILYDISMVLSVLRRTLIVLYNRFQDLDPDQYLQPVEDQDFHKDWHEDEGEYSINYQGVCANTEHQMAQVHLHRKFFIVNLEKANEYYQSVRFRMNEESREVLEDPHTREIGGQEKSSVAKALEGQDLHNQETRTRICRLIRAFPFSVDAEAAFTLFDSLEECVDSARLKYDMEDW